MRFRHFLVAFVVGGTGAPAFGIEPADLKPGLIATYRDDPKTAVTRLEPTVALTLASKAETPHPALAAGGAMAWKGYLNITRRGGYTFSANVRGGKLTVKV
ncbi:MAG: hypothetical protein K2V38_16955, partial [Gemmataceae bacterium]|nr:hypothetical protein [Gemmataceae bacterium]